MILFCVLRCTGKGKKPGQKPLTLLKEEIRVSSQTIYPCVRAKQIQHKAVNVQTNKNNSKAENVRLMQFLFKAF